MSKPDAVKFERWGDDIMQRLYDEGYTPTVKHIRACYAEIDRLSTPSAASPGMLTGWLDIETAPKGEWVLLHGDDLMIGVGALQFALGRHDEKPHYFWEVRGVGGEGRRLTHWQPLPEPPKLANRPMEGK